MDLDRVDWSASRGRGERLEKSDAWYARWAGFGPVAAAVGYFLGSMAGLSLQFPGTQISVFWPPNAILLAALLLTSKSKWWHLLAAVLPAHALAQLSMGIAFPVMLVNFAGNAGDALLAALLIHRLLPEPRRFDQLRAVTLIVVCGGLLAPAVTSLVVAQVFAGMGATSSLWISWRLRVLTNALAVITLVPPLLLAFSPLSSWHAAVRSRRREAAALAIGLLVVGLLVFTLSPAGVEGSALTLYLPLPFLLWATMRFGLVGASLSVLALGGLALSAAVRGLGPFATLDPTENATSLVLFLLVSGIPLLLLAAVMNERATVDEGRRRIETLHDAVLGSLREEIAVVGRDGTILEVNDSWRGSGRAGPGSDLLEGCGEEAMQLGYAGDQLLIGLQAVLTGSRDRFRLDLPSPASTGAWFELSAQALRRPEGGAVITRTDVTARKEAELDAREQRRELAHMTRVATLGEISGAMAHELSQPLTAILSNAQAARRLLSREAPDLREIGAILADIVDDDRRAGQVIERLRAMLRKDEPQFSPLDLNEVVREVLALERSDLIARAVVVVPALATDLRPVHGDRVQLQQVVLNLVLNACEAMSSVDVRDRRIVVATSRDEGRSELKVVDCGTGIAADALERVFEPFFTTKRQGLGLGLSICRSIVETHGGRLWASNNEGSGATFHLSLPAHEPRTS